MARKKPAGAARAANASSAASTRESLDESMENIRSAMRNNMRGALKDNVKDNVKDAVKDTAKDSTKDTGRDSVRDRAQARPREKKQGADAANTNDTIGYDTLAGQTMELWREQLSAFLGSPQSMRDFASMMAPAATFFTQGVDLWLMMMERAGAAANQNRFVGQHGAEKSWGTRSRPNGGGTNGASPASAVSGAGTYAVAQLAARLADLEKRFAEYEGTGPAAAPVAARRAKKTKGGSGSGKRAAED
jgi:hypothetical protein